MARPFFSLQDDTGYPLRSNARQYACSRVEKWTMSIQRRSSLQALMIRSESIRARAAARQVVTVGCLASAPSIEAEPQSRRLPSQVPKDSPECS